MALRIEWDRSLLLSREKRGENIGLEILARREALKLLFDARSYGLIPTPLVPLAFESNIIVRLARLGFANGALVEQVGGWLAGDGDDRSITINEQLWVIGRRRALAHEIGHAILPTHIDVERRIEYARDEVALRAFGENEASLVGDELRFQGPLFWEYTVPKPLCLSAALEAGENQFRVAPVEAAHRYVSGHSRPCAFLHMQRVGDALLIETAATSRSLSEFCDLDTADLNAPDGELPTFVESCIARAKPSYRTDAKHKVVKVRTGLGGVTPLQACVNASAGAALVMLSPSPDHTKRSGAVASTLDPPDPVPDLVQKCLRDPLIGPALLSEFGDLPDRRLLEGLVVARTLAKDTV